MNEPTEFSCPLAPGLSARVLLLASDDWTEPEVLAILGRIEQMLRAEAVAALAKAEKKGIMPGRPQANCSGS